MSVYYLSAKFSVLSACLVFNESFKSRTAAGGGYIHFLYFTCAMAREKEGRGLGGGGARGGCGGCRVVVMNVLQLKRILCHFPGEREIKVVAGERRCGRRCWEIGCVVLMELSSSQPDELSSHSSVCVHLCICVCVCEYAYMCCTGVQNEIKKEGM